MKGLALCKRCVIRTAPSPVAHMFNATVFRKCKHPSERYVKSIAMAILNKALREGHRYGWDKLQRCRFCDKPGNGMVTSGDEWCARCVSKLSPTVKKKLWVTKHYGGNVAFLLHRFKCAQFSQNLLALK